MKYRLLAASPLLVGLILLVRSGSADEPAAANSMLSHDVYFSLKDNSSEGKKKVVEACKKYLTGHPGTVFFAAGVLAEELTREVNDRDFDVSLHIVFKDKAAHDKYQDAERHKQFIAEVKDGLKKVRVFDSVVETSAGKVRPVKD
jgi:hypothetical protein